MDETKSAVAHTTLFSVYCVHNEFCTSFDTSNET